MFSVNKDIAEREIARLKCQKRPQVYCVVRYQNRLNGDSEKYRYSGYAICYKPKHYQALMQSNFVGGIDVLWFSERFKFDEARQELED